MRDYTAIIIAAGLSSRMGDFKPLLDIGEKPALFRLLDSIKTAGIERIVVVTGYKRTLLEKTILEYGGDGVVSVYNEDYEIGMFSSVQTGIRRAIAECGAAFNGVTKAALLFPVDVPLVSVRTIRGLIAAYERAASSCFAVPVYQGKNGHPLLVPGSRFGEILGYTGEGGLKGVRSMYDSEMLRYPVKDAGCVLDMDTPEDYKHILDYDKRKNNK